MVETEIQNDGNDGKRRNRQNRPKRRKERKGRKNRGVRKFELIYCVGLKGKHIVQVSAGERHGVALTKEGEVYSWGTNSNWYGLIS